ncbi:NAD(P)(+) transhydrogenase (Re/Si-specific) subunit alpha, partial [Ancylobacter lacus]|nr:NAD(P)(+) transhydrogenase (Re/Si-specific) subunit alpha [Ancylobacter lacus]MBS7541165.1 NAD(P)(+) transhydrogenase (Re/Si-specific) subunit alpha [Ancylobacter lacus]
MRIGVFGEVSGVEPRVGATPDTVKRLLGLGASVAVASGAGLRSGITD